MGDAPGSSVEQEREVRVFQNAAMPRLFDIGKIAVGPGVQRALRPEACITKLRGGRKRRGVVEILQEVEFRVEAAEEVREVADMDGRFREQRDAGDAQIGR